jgi:hypothetical protein
VKLDPGAHVFYAFGFALKSGGDTKPKNKPVPKMVRKWVPKIATPAKSIDPKKPSEEV